MEVINRVIKTIFIILALSTFFHYISIGIDIDPTPENIAKLTRFSLILSMFIVLLQLIGYIMTVIIKRLNLLSKDTFVIVLLSALITSFKGIDEVIINSIFIIIILIVRSKNVIK